jgi:hypothetical protein
MTDKNSVERQVAFFKAMLPELADHLDPQLCAVAYGKKFEPTEAVTFLARAFVTAFSYTVADINRGDCELFAAWLILFIGGGEIFWGDELTNPNEDVDKYSYHCFVRYEGRFYDAEHPYGVDDFRELAAFQDVRLPELCRMCRQIIFRDDQGSWLDDTGGDVCGALGGNEPHVPFEEDEDD